MRGRGRKRGEVGKGKEGEVQGEVRGKEEKAWSVFYGDGARGERGDRLEDCLGAFHRLAGRLMAVRANCWLRSHYAVRNGMNFTPPSTAGV